MNPFYKKLEITPEVRRRVISEVKRRLEYDNLSLDESLREIIINKVTAIQLEEELKSTN